MAEIRSAGPKADGSQVCHRTPGRGGIRLPGATADANWPFCADVVFLGRNPMSWLFYRAGTSWMPVPMTSMSREACGRQRWPASGLCWSSDTSCPRDVVEWPPRTASLEADGGASGAAALHKRLRRGRRGQTAAPQLCDRGEEHPGAGPSGAREMPVGRGGLRFTTFL